jgi:hypothetical protein
MVKTEFEGFLKTLFDYFDKMAPKAVSLDLWFKEVESIPAKALPPILSGLYRSDMMPRNLPKAMWAIFYELLATNPKESNGACECLESRKDKHGKIMGPVGFWEVAFYRPELRGWDIFKIACSCITENGPRTGTPFLIGAGITVNLIVI